MHHTEYQPRAITGSKPRGIIGILLAAIATLALTSTSVEAQSKDGKQGKPKQDKQSTKLAKWPTLKKAASDRARATAKQFKKPQEKLHVEASRKLIAIGAGAAPAIISLVSDRSQNTNEHLFAVLDAIVDKSHASLLAREAKRPSVEWRRYLIRKLAGFHDADMAPVFKSALKDKDPDIAIYAGLGLLSLGKHDGLDTVLLAAKQRWTEFGEITSKVLPAGRAGACALPVFEKIASARPTDQMAGLRLLRYLMVKDQGMLLRAYLSSSDFAVKKEAINTARVLHGEKPLDKLSSFQAIDQAKKWLLKI
ncbi:MAG: hypothetical protein ACI89X_002267 [Planctomycetota bacterium]|jgi:hypothetical protein